MLLVSASYIPIPLTDTPQAMWMAGPAVKCRRLPYNTKSNVAVSLILFINTEKDLKMTKLIRVT